VSTTRARRAPLAAFIVANVVSIAGTRVSAIAIPWFVLTTTGSAAKTGLVVVFEMTPLVVTKALCGPLIDRVGPRRVSIVADSLSTVVIATIPVLHLLGVLGFPVLLGLVAVAGLIRGPGDTAKWTLVPDIAETAKVPVERVTGLESTTDRGASIIAPAAAGILITAVGPTTALFVDAASFAVCAVLMAIWAPRRQHAAEEEQDEGSYLKRLHAGWQVLSRDPLLRAITIMVCVTNLLDAAAQSVLVPVWILDSGYGPAQIGLLGSAFGITATAGALLAAGFGDRLPRRMTYLVGFFIAGAPRFIVLALGAPLWVVAVVWAVAGFGAGFLNPIIGAVYIQRVPRAKLGRVGALSDSVAWAGIPFGGVLAGAAIAGIGLAPALLVAGGIYFAATTVPGFLSQWREMDARPLPPAEELEPAGVGTAVAAGPAPHPADRAG
jgi:MFS family permease